MGKTLGYGEITVANMTEPFTVMLTNEAQQFATDSNRKVTSAQSYYTDIIVIRGSQERTDYTIGNITSGSGITVSKNSKRVTFSVSAGTTIGADAGVIEIPITLDGQTVKKQFSWSCGKQGPQGVKGNDGNSFAWNMLSETNCGKKHWGTESSGGKYSVEDFITEDNIDAVKLICTEAISTSNWSYVLFKDIKMLKQLKPSTKYTLSYDIKANRSGAISHSICKGDVSNFCTNIVVVNNIIGNETWQHISVVLTTNDLKTTPTNEILYLRRNALSKVGYSIIKNLKLVEGDIDTPWSPSQSDIEGKGVVETVQYYLATSQASGVTSSTSGWSTDITTQKLTADKKYLWNCYQTKYSDGTSEPISTPKVIGVYGDKGTSTKIIRTGYKYTQNNIDTFSASGYSRTWDTADATTGLKVGDNVLLRVKNTTKGSDCLIFASITAIPSNYSLTCTSYGLIDNGADGQDGEDGAGFHWNLLKYSGDLSKQVLGGAGTYTATVESIEDKTTPSGQAEKITYTVQGTGGKFIQTGKYIKEGDIKQGKTYTVSVWCKCSSIKSTGVINAEFLDNKTYVNPTLSTEWQQYVVTGVANKDVTSTSSASAISFYYSDNMSVGDIFYISSPKVEEGDKASPWCTTYEETLAKNLSITPSSQYFKSTDGGKTFAPNTITIKPTIQGEISFGKWQYSIDGGVSFADAVSGQKGLTISNNVLTVSKDSSLYSDAVTMVTFRAVASDSSFYDTCSIAKIYDVSDIGDGRNLLWNSNFAKTDETINTSTFTTWGLILRGSTYTATIDTSVKHNNFNTLKVIGTKAGDSGGQDLVYRIKGLNLDEVKFTETDVKYTLSFYAKASIACNFSARYSYDSYAKDTNVALSTDWKRYEIQMHPTTTSYQTSLIFKMDAASTVWFSEFKLEKGSSATGYSTAPEDVQVAILSTKSEISDVSLKVDKNKQAIEQRVEKTTYQQDLNLVKGDISKANEGLNKWRYEIYPKSLFASEYQGKSTMDVFAKNTNLTPSQSVLINDTDFGKNWAYGDNYIGYALTFVKFSAAKSVAITFKHDDGAHLYLNGKLIGGDDTCNTGSGESLTLSFIQGWNCLEVVLNEKSGGEYIGLGTTISAISECQLMNCYYGTPVARQSHITNQLVQNTTDIDGVSGSVQKVMSTVGDSGKIDEFVSNYATWKKKVDGIETRVGETYTTKSDFNGLEIGGRNLLTKDDCNMSKWQNLYPAHCKVTNNDYSNHIDYVPTGGEWEIIYKKISVTKGQKYILSFDYKVNKAYNYLSGQKYGVYLSTSVPTNAAPTNIITDGQYAIENTVTSIKRGVITFTAPIDTLYIAINGGCIDDNQTGLSFEFNKWKLEKGNKATDWTPASEDNKINGQNLVSNLPTNWEQGSVQCNTGSIYSGIKTATTTRLRVKDVFSVSGNVTISAGTSTNSSKEDLNFYYVLFDVNKKEISNSSTWQSLTSAKIINCGDAKYMAIILRWGSATTMMNPSDISQICLKIERGTSATPFTLAPEDVNGKIVNVETIANQTANKFEWIVKGGDSSSNFTLTDRVADLVAERINFKGLVTFSGLSTDAKNEIGKVAQSKVDGLEVGGRNLIINSNLSRTLTNVTNDGCSNMTVVSDSVYGHALKFTAVNKRRVFWATSNVWVKDKTYTVSFVAKSSVTGQKIRPSRSTADWGDDITLTTSYARYTTKITSLDTNAGGTLSFSCTNAVGDITITNVKLEVGNKATDWTPAPEDVSQDATNKASQALTDAKNYSSNAVNWVTNNGSSTTSLNSMVKKWTDGAVSDTTQINGGWIKANTITASKIAVGDFTNYADINESNTYGFSVEKTTDGVWFSKDGSKLTRDNYISKMYSCEPGQTFYVEYDISNTIKDSTEYKAAGIMLFGCDGTQTVKWYQRRGAVVGTAAGTVTHMSQQLTMPSGTRFFYVVLQIEGFQPFTGTLKIRNLSVRKAVTGAVIVDGSITADKIATDAIKSRNYISSGGTQGSFLNLSDGSFQSPNLSWDANGNLIAKNATLSGEITATNGSIAGWTIISNKMYTTGSGKYTGIGKYGSAYAFWAGATSNDNGNSAVFKVSHTGKLTATDADITGTITATNGKIGRYDITSTYLMTNSGSNASGIGGNQAFWAGAEDSNSAPFRVGYDGVLWAENAAIRGSIETGNLGDEGDTVSIINGHIGIQGTSNNVEIYSTGFKFGIDGDYYLMSVSEGVKCYRNLYATDFVADGWLYCSEVHSSGAVVIGADSESFYWAHGYQIARGTSWGGVCVGDDSQQLRLYGSSIWASHSISTSDENLKENFTTLDQYENFYMNLNPIGFNYIGDYDGKKTHFGFGAHKTEDVLESEGYDADKFAVVTHRPLVQEDIEKRFGKDVEVDIETEYGVSYTEFIALNTHMIQKTRRELTKVKQEKADLEVRLQAIEAKLGL